MHTRKHLAICLGLLSLCPLVCRALESTDLAVDLGEDLAVSVGEKFTITVKSAYDKTESCSQFFYDWRQSKGPITANPLNNNVLAPEFQLNTAGEYVFSLAIETRCDDTRIRSETDKVTVTVTEVESTETKNYNHEILPRTVTLTADGEASWDLNFFLGSATEKPSGEKIEFTLNSENEILKNNLGKLEALSEVTRNGVVALSYTAPEITDANWTGGTVVIEAKSAYGGATANITLKPRTANCGANLTVAQTANDLPYLVQNQKTLGLLEIKILDTDQTKIGVVDVTLNGNKIEHMEKVFFREWTDAQKENYENYVNFYFTPNQEDNTLTAKIEIGGETLVLTKNFKAYVADTLTLDIVALAEGKWADLSTVDLSEILKPQMEFLEERVPTTLTAKNPLAQTPVVKKEQIQPTNFVVMPEGYSGEILSKKSLHSDGDEFELAKVYFTQFVQKGWSIISDRGVWIDRTKSANLNDRGFELITAETPSVLADIGGKGLPYELAWASLASLRQIPEFTDWNNKHWSYGYLSDLIGRGIVSGYANGTMRPDREITRAEFVKILLSAGNIAVNTAQNNTNFRDMSGVDWSLPYVEQALRYGLVGGYADGTFRPNKSITRAEAVKILAEFQNLDLPENTESVFMDVADDTWYAPYVEAVREAGIVTGYADGTFKPEKAITRAEASKIIEKSVWGE